MTIGYVLRHPVLAFNRKFVCSYWGHDTRGGTWAKTFNGVTVVTSLPPIQCTRCQDVV